MLKNYLIDHLPSFLIRRLAKPYIAGQKSEAAIQKADFLWKNQGIASTVPYTRLYFVKSKIATILVSVLNLQPLD